MNQILAYITGQGPGLNDLQRGEVRRHFEMTRSQLYEYGILGKEPNYEFHMTPASRVAVRPTKRALVPMMIALVPPDIFPSPRYITKAVPAPPDVEIKLIGTRNPRGQVLIGSEVSGTRVTTDSAEPEDTRGIEVLTREYIADDRGGTEYLQSLRARYETFRTQRRRAEKEMEDYNTEIVIGRPEVRDTMAAQHPEMQRARDPNDDEAYIRAQVEAMRNLPPLIMYINPSQFSIAYNHVISDGNRSRTGFIIEHWGLQQPVITASGQIGGTYVHNRNGGRGGLTRYFQKDSASYQYFMNLFRIYKNNAYIYNTHDLISMMGSVKIFYDDAIYTGSFDSLSISETEDKPFDLSYNFQFTVRFEERLTS